MQLLPNISSQRCSWLIFILSFLNVLNPFITELNSVNTNLNSTMKTQTSTKLLTIYLRPIINRISLFKNLKAWTLYTICFDLNILVSVICDLFFLLVVHWWECDEDAYGHHTWKLITLIKILIYLIRFAL